MSSVHLLPRGDGLEGEGSVSAGPVPKGPSSPHHRGPCDAVCLPAPRPTSGGQREAAVGRREASRQPSTVGVRLREARAAESLLCPRGAVGPTEQGPRQLAHCKTKVTWVAKGGPRGLRETPGRGQVCHAMHRCAQRAICHYYLGDLDTATENS